MCSFRCICLVMVLLFIPTGVPAYVDAGNRNVHTEINRQAILQFEQTVMRGDPFLKTASLDGNESWGRAWDRESEGGPGDTLFPPDTRPDLPARKSLKGWILSGAYSADEPEGAMGLVHFYDPTVMDGNGYLTDQQFLINLLAWAWNPRWANPRTDAVRWGVRDIDLHNQSGEVFSQEYSFADARRNLKKALAAQDDYNEYYGKAWRGVGETMHILADMTVPAHVRNDAHPAALLDADPYEQTTTVTDILASAGGTPADLDYRTDTETLMRSVARFTNAHYFSQDTIDSRTSSGAAYREPSLTGPEDGAGYLHDNVSHADTRVAHRSGSAIIYDQPNGTVFEKPVYEIDTAVAGDQRTVLVPTAIRADAAVLDRFLPRFIATMSYDYADLEHPDPGNYTMHGTIRLAEDAWNRDEWGDLPVNNGAIILLRDERGAITRLPVDPHSVSTMNDFTCTFSAGKNEEVGLMYDLGGYTVVAETTGMPKPVAA